MQSNVPPILNKGTRENLLPENICNAANKLIQDLYGKYNYPIVEIVPVLLRNRLNTVLDLLYYPIPRDTSVCIIISFPTKWDETIIIMGEGRRVKCSLVSALTEFEKIVQKYKSM